LRSRKRCDGREAKQGRRGSFANPRRAVVALDGPDTTQVGVLLAATGTRDIADAHVGICAHRSQQASVTSDPEDLRRLDPRAGLIGI
jgi:hypothetical protein